jgi:hypothetical protein
MLKAVLERRPGEFWKSGVVYFFFVNFGELRSEGLHEKLAVAAWTLGNI